MNIRFTVPSVPIAQPRTKVSSFGGHVRAYTPKTVTAKDGTKKPHPVAAFKATCRMAAQESYSGPPIDGPLELSVVFVMPRPQAMRWKRRHMPRVPHLSKPDIDNLCKSLFDSLNSLLWMDDRQIWSLTTSKVYASGDEQPHVEILLAKADKPDCLS